MSTPGNRCFCAKEHACGLQQKRKRALDSDPDPDPWRKGTQGQKQAVGQCSIGAPSPPFWPLGAQKPALQPLPGQPRRRTRVRPGRTLTALPPPWAGPFYPSLFPSRSRAIPGLGVRSQRDKAQDSRCHHGGKAATRPGGPEPLPPSGPVWACAGAPGPSCPLSKQSSSRGCSPLGVGAFVPSRGLGAAHVYPGWCLGAPARPAGARGPGPGYRDALPLPTLATTVAPAGPPGTRESLWTPELILGATLVLVQ